MASNHFVVSLRADSIAKINRQAFARVMGLPLEKLPVDDVMKGRPISGEEFERMMDVTPNVVGPNAAPSWQFVLRLLWESGFRVGELMDLSWEDDRHIDTVWPRQSSQHATVSCHRRRRTKSPRRFPCSPAS